MRRRPRHRPAERSRASGALSWVVGGCPVAHVSASARAFRPDGSTFTSSALRHNRTSPCRGERRALAPAPSLGRHRRSHYRSGVLPLAAIRSAAGCVLLAEQLGSCADHLRGRRGRDGGGCAARAPPAGASRDASGALRRAAGRAAGGRRAHPRVRPVPGRRPIRGSTGCRGLGCQRDRNDVFAGPTPRRTGTDLFARAAARLQRPCATHVSRGAEQSRDATDDRGGGHRPATTVAPGRSGDPRRTDRSPRRGCTSTP